MLSGTCGNGFGADDAAFLADNGFNAVRVGVYWASVEPEPGVFNDAYLASVAQTVQTLADHGIVSVLDMHQDLYSAEVGGHGAPEWATETGGLPNLTQAGFPFSYALNPAEIHAWDAFWSNANAPDGVGPENHYAQMWEHVANYFKGGERHRRARRLDPQRPRPGHRVRRRRKHRQRHCELHRRWRSRVKLA